MRDRRRLVPVCMMHIGRMGVGMLYLAVYVRVRMGLSGRILRSVRMLMMGIVDMEMFVGHRLVNMFVFVMLGGMEPDAERHQNTCGQ